jgi:hypothetical protein
MRLLQSVINQTQQTQSQLHERQEENRGGFLPEIENQRREIERMKQNQQTE